MAGTSSRVVRVERIGAARGLRRPVDMGVVHLARVKLSVGKVVAWPATSSGSEMEARAASSRRVPCGCVWARYGQAGIVGWRSGGTGGFVSYGRLVSVRYGPALLVVLCWRGSSLLGPGSRVVMV